MSSSGSDEPAAPGLLAAITALRAAAENADGGALADILAPDVVFHAPLSSRIRFEGRDEVTALHRDIFAVLEGLSTTEPMTRGDTGVFTFSGHVRGLKLDAMNLVRVDEQGQIVEFTIFARPLPALATLFATLPPRVTARRRGRTKGALVAALAAPLGFALRTADVLVPRLIWPRSLAAAWTAPLDDRTLRLDRAAASGFCVRPRRSACQLESNTCSSTVVSVRRRRRWSTRLVGTDL